MLLLLLLVLLLLVGLVTVTLASLAMLTQTAIKSSLAWSTAGQLGFMLVELGLGLFVLALGLFLTGGGPLCTDSLLWRRGTPAPAKKKGEENAIKRAEEEKLKQAEREERLAESEAASRLRIAAPGTCWSPVLYRAVSWEKSSTGIFDLALALAPRLGPRLALAVCAC